MAEHGIAPIDLLVLNLYPFEKVSADPASTLDEIVENIDIGGPAMLRSAAKNFARVAVATDPAQYAGIVDELDGNDGTLSARTRFALRSEEHTSELQSLMRNSYAVICLKKKKNY